jgi:molecular chaperone Hsp31 and glyoxalase 3
MRHRLLWQHWFYTVSWRSGLWLLSSTYKKGRLLCDSWLREENYGKPIFYEDHKFAAFHDAADKQTQTIGYMSGHMPWRFGEKLNAPGT